MTILEAQALTKCSLVLHDKFKQCQYDILNRHLASATAARRDRLGVIYQGLIHLLCVVFYIFLHKATIHWSQCGSMLDPCVFKSTCFVSVFPSPRSAPTLSMVQQRRN
jgi:hypothetical protein